MRRVLMVSCVILLGMFVGVLWLVEGGQQGVSSAPVSVRASSMVLGSPSVPASFINEVLAAYGSPAAGSGQALYDEGVQSGIDPVFALAFFMHESSFGKYGVAAVTHSLGNIRCSFGYVCVDGFRWYASWQAGYVDWYRLIRRLYVEQWGLVTVEQIVPVYAPSSDHNDVRAYIQAVEQAVATWRGGRVLVASDVWHTKEGMLWSCVNTTVGKISSPGWSICT